MTTKYNWMNRCNNVLTEFKQNNTSNQKGRKKLNLVMDVKINTFIIKTCVYEAIIIFYTSFWILCLYTSILCSRIELLLYDVGGKSHEFSVCRKIGVLGSGSSFTEESRLKFSFTQFLLTPHFLQSFLPSFTFSRRSERGQEKLS